MSKFHIGDKVKCTDNFLKYPCKDKIGRIIDSAEDCSYDVVGVEFENYVYGHSCSNRGHAGCCLFLPSKLLVSIDAESNMLFEDKLEFTDKEILDSLYTCSRSGCIGCSLKGYDHCITRLLILAIEIIQRQQKEINDAKSCKEFDEKVATDATMIEKGD